MLYNTFDKIEALNGVKTAVSENDNSPLLDENITLFLDYGYRLISRKSLLGQSIEVAKYDEQLDDYVPNLEALTYHNIDKVFGTKKIKQKDQFASYHEGAVDIIDSTLFMHSLSAVISNDVMMFLKKRHSSLPFFAIHTFKIEEPIKDPKIENPNRKTNKK